LVLGRRPINLKLEALRRRRQCASKEACTYESMAKHEHP